MFLYKTLQAKACIYFASGFTLLWIICNVVLYYEFQKTIWSNFDKQMNTQASLILNSTSINPKLVPLPQSGENYMIVYTDFYGSADTLFVPPKKLLDQLQTERHIRFEEEISEGRLTILYSISSDDVNSSVDRVNYIFILAFIVELTLAVAIGYWLSKRIIKPVKDVIRLADATDLQNNTILIEEPKDKDELKLLITSFNRMLLRIREQSELQKTFFASASHELRTPLSIMQTRLQILLLDKEITSEVKRIYQEQLADVKRMVGMVNDFLLMSELQNGNMHLNTTECDLSDMVTTIILQNKEKKNDRNLNFKISFIPVDESFTVEADKDKLYIILTNLITNSLKYSPMASVIDVTLQKTEENRIAIRIKNNIREGINPDISTVKKSFYHSKPLNGEGSGLGLWIANKLSELNNFNLAISIHDNTFEAILYLWNTSKSVAHA